MIKVSVVMPVYNVEKYLEEALLSVMNQTLREIEIICVNDGSTDGSLNILKKYADMDERIRIISKENSGYGHTMNVGIDAAQGEYIGVVETDDYIDTDMMEVLYQGAVINQLDMIKAGYREFVVNEAGDRIFKNVSILPSRNVELYGRITGWETDFSVFDSDVVTWAGIYRRDFLNQHHIRHNETPGASFQDNGFWFQVMMYAKRVMFLEDLFYNLRRDNPNSSVKSKDKVFCICDEFDFIRKKIERSELANKKRLLQTAFLYRFSSYQFHYNRVANEWKPVMMERIRQDVIYALENGEVAADMFTKVLWNQLFAILNEGKMIAPENVFIPDWVKQRVEEAEEIYIYGAGMWGKNVYNKLRKCFGVEKIKSFLVTELTNGQDTLFELPIMQIDDVELKENVLVIAAVSDKYLGEVITTFLSIGHSNFMLKNDLF